MVRTAFREWRAAVQRVAKARRLMRSVLGSITASCFQKWAQLLVARRRRVAMTRSQSFVKRLVNRCAGSVHVPCTLQRRFVFPYTWVSFRKLHKSTGCPEVCICLKPSVHDTCGNAPYSHVLTTYSGSACPPLCSPGLTTLPWRLSCVLGVQQWSQTRGPGICCFGGYGAPHMVQ